MKRFFVNFKLGEDFELTGGEHHHLANVLRCKVGEKIIVCCNDEYDYHYEIKSIQKNKTQLLFSASELNTANPKKRISVFLALIKPEKIALVIQKLNEIGVVDITLFSSDYCNISPKTISEGKLIEIANQSSKQCGRSISLSLHDILTFDEMCDSFRNSDCVLFADETERNVSLSSVGLDSSNFHAIVIGPEGGFSENERNKLRKIAQPVSLGCRILRAETAAIVASTIVLSKLGEI